MKVLSITLLGLWFATVCHAQELTKDGYGGLHWGASIAEAEKLYPDFKIENVTADKGWINDEDGIPCDLRLGNRKNNNFVMCNFYEGKFVSAITYVLSREISPEIFKTLFTDDFRNELRGRILKQLGNTEELNIHIQVAPGAPTMKSSISKGRTDSAYIAILIRLSNKKIAQAATHVAEQRFQAQVDKVKSELLTTVPGEALKP